MSIIIPIITFLLGVALGIKLVFYSIDKKEKEEIAKSEDIFKDILKNKSSLKFIQRMHDYVQLNTFDNHILYYMIESKEFSLFDGDKYIADSSKIKSSIKTKLLNYINKNFNNEINVDVSNIGGYIISNNYINVIAGNTSNIDTDNKNNLNLDEILDKISTSGISSLCKEELEFLNSFKNKK